ncbi:MAG: T9SS type A sorting domain-containing protein [Bacteroidales bacterium]|nr:T9SS type A sorting domain-containing protein [Bacteroidales bacterium]MCF8328146.1 T9SS type A sorting domain-containing protein [Bacteroidales bacterium]
MKLFTLKSPPIRLLLIAAMLLTTSLSYGQNTYNQPTQYGGSWNDASNWSYGHVPDNTEDVLIPAGNEAYIDNDNGTAKNITIEGDLNITETYTLTVNGDLTINGVLQHKGNNLIISGDLQNDGTITKNSDIITFSGSVSSTISGSSSINFADMEVNKSAGEVSLSNGITISSSLTLTSGNITTNGNPLVFEDNATVSGNSSSNYITGTVTKKGDDSFTFPVADNGYYGAATVDNTGGATTDQFSVTYHRGTPPNFSNFNASNHTDLETISQLEYWQVTRDNGSSSPDLTLHWADGADSDINNESKIHLVHDNGTTWDDLGQDSFSGSGGSGSSGSVKVNTVSSFSTFTFGSTDASTDPLPVDLISFEANCSGQNKAIVNWSTATEINNDYFEIQVSRDGENFSSKKTVNGAGNSNERKDYESTVNLEEQESYVRLKQVDYDGKSETFDPVYVQCNTEKQNIKIYPNPVVQDLNIHLQNQPEEKVQVSVYTIHGKRVFAQTFKGNSKNLKLTGIDHLPEGIYFLEMIMKDQRVIRKFSK